MTGESRNAGRAVVLSLVMVLSVVAAGVAFSGSATAQTEPDITVKPSDSTQTVVDKIESAGQGDVVVIENGVNVNLPESVNLANSSVVIRGEDADLENGPVIQMDNLGTGTEGFSIRAKNVSIRNLRITDDTSSGVAWNIRTTDNGTEVDNVKISRDASNTSLSGLANPAINFIDVSDVTVTNSTLANGSVNVRLNNGGNATIQGNEFSMPEGFPNAFFITGPGFNTLSDNVDLAIGDNGGLAYADRTESDYIRGFTTISGALNAPHTDDPVATGESILVEPGTFTEQITIDKSVTITGSGMDSTVLDANNSSKSGNQHAIVVRSNNTTVSDLTMTDGHDAIRLSQSAHVENFTLSDVRVNDSNVGIYVAGNAVDSKNGEFNNVHFENTHWINNQRKAIYVEKLSNATFEETYIDGVTGPSYGFINGFDINLKGGSYQNITIQNSVVKNVAQGDPYDDVSSFSAAIAVKGRDDSSYSGNPGSLDGLTINNVTVEDSFNGLRLGEPTKSISTPENVTITDSTFRNNTGYHFEDITATPLDVANVTDDNTFASGVVVDSNAKVWANIQDAVDAAQSGDTVNVGSATYEESVTIATDNITLRGHNNPTIVGDGANEGSQPHAAIHVRGNPTTTNITIEGFRVRNPDGHYGIYAGEGGSNSDVDGLEVRGNLIEDIATNISSHDPLAGSAAGLYVRAEYDSVTIEWNVVRDVDTTGDQWQNAVGLSFSSFIGDEAFAGGGDAGSETAENTVVRHNRIYDISGAESSRTKGISVSGEFDGVVIQNNTVTDITAPTSDSDALAITLTENPPKSGSDFDNDGTNERIGPRNFTVLNNTVDRVSAGSPTALFVGGYEDLGSDHVAVYNDFNDGTVGRYAQDQAGFSFDDADPLNVRLNWWNSTYGPIDENSSTGVEGYLSYDPFLTAPSDQVDTANDDDEIITRQFASDLELDEGVNALAFPAPSERTLSETLETSKVETIYAFDNVEGSWTQVTAANNPMPDALDVYVVVVEDGETAGAVMEFNNTRANNPTPGSTEVSGGWNLLAPSQASDVDADEAFVEQNVRVESTLANPPYDAPKSQPFGTGDLAFSPYEGYWTFLDDQPGDSRIAAQTYKGITLEEYLQNVNLEDEDN